MFTGIIQTTGTAKTIVKQAKTINLEIQAPAIQGIHLGDSVSVNGVCLTITKISKQSIFVTIMNETLKVTTFNKLKVGSLLNLELAMGVDSRFNGHIVSGHVDGVGTISEIKPDGVAKLYTIKAEPNVLRYVIHKGSITVDGISLTVAKVTKLAFCVAIIPHTAEVTTIGKKKIGDQVNLECDLMAKYFEKFIQQQEINNTKKGGSNE